MNSPILANPGKEIASSLIWTDVPLPVRFYSTPCQPFPGAALCRLIPFHGTLFKTVSFHPSRMIRTSVMRSLKIHEVCLDCPVLFIGTRAIIRDGDFRHVLLPLSVRCGLRHPSGCAEGYGQVTGVGDLGPVPWQRRPLSPVFSTASMATS